MKRLYRSKRDVMIAGVCAGLADYLNVDVTIVRLVFVLLLFTFAGGFWIYLVMWIVVPLEPDGQSEILEVEAKPKKTAPKQVTAPKKPAATTVDVEESQEEKPSE